MAKRQQAARSRPRSPARPQPRRGGFVRSVLLILVGAAGVHFYHAGPPEWMAGSSGGSVNADRPASPRTSFDFYNLLPKKVVAVDEPAPPPEKAPPAQRPAAPARPPPARSASLRTPPVPAGTPAAPREPAALAAAPAASVPAGRYRIQAGAFRERGDADRLRASLILEGMDSHIRTSRTADGVWHRVMVGPFEDRAAAEKASSRLRTSRELDGRIVREGG